MTYTAQPSKSQFGHPQVHANSAGASEHDGGETWSLKLPISFANLDGDVLYTVPTGLRMLVDSVLWEVTTAFTGGSSSAIGLSSSEAPHDTAGDILGGAAGDVAATLVAGVKRGTQGVSITATPNCIVLDAGATIKFNRITSAFTAGAGFVHIAGRMIG